MLEQARKKTYLQRADWIQPTTLHFANRRGEVDSIGVKRLGFEASYRVLFGLTSYSVKAEYGFDESDRLVDIVVYLRTPMSEL